MLSASDIQKFQQLYFEEYGIYISTEDAAEQGMKLLTMMSHVYKPMTQQEYEKTIKARAETVEQFVEMRRV